MLSEDNYEEECEKAIKRLDDFVKDFPVQPPELVEDAIAFTVDYVLGLPLPSAQKVKILVASMKQIYRSGYREGLADRKEQLKT